MGRWKADGVQVDIRSDGYVRVTEGSLTLREGQLLVAGAAATVQLCAPPSAAIGFAEDGAPTWDGEALELVERDWDEKAVAAETARREAARRSSRSSGGDFDFDFD